jgi:hypothetical protein
MIMVIASRWKGFGNAYVTGSTVSVDFPEVNPIQQLEESSYHVFVAKLNPNGSALMYSVRVGGHGNETDWIRHCH